MSYRNTAHVVRRIRQGASDARTPLTTLVDLVERERSAVQAWIAQKTATTLAQYEFTAAGARTTDTPVKPLADQQGRLPQKRY